MTKAPSILDAVGNTPLVRLSSFQKWIPSGVLIWAKCEFKNPGGSVKDRPARKMILEASKSGALTQDKIILDSSSGKKQIIDRR